MKSEARPRKDMLCSVDECLTYLLERTPLTTGDPVFTGTTCGTGKDDSHYLEPGDEMESETEEIGILRTVVGRRVAIGQEGRAHD